MVNVGGRSRGCSTCRRRRVKCDETRPICNRCRRCGYQCNGAKDISFIVQDRGEMVRGASLNQSPGSQPEPGSGDIAYSALSPSLHLRGFEVQIYISYATEHLLRGGPVYMILQGIGLWDMQAAADERTNGQLLPRAILGFAMIFFASQQKVLSIQNRSYSLYGKTLKQLNDVLSEPDCYTRDDVLLSVVTLALRERFIPTEKGHYRQHICGMERILELRGPQGFTTEASLQLLIGVRRIMLVSSVLTRAPTILAREEWKFIPWNTVPNKNMDTLCNALADTAVMVAELDKVRSEIYSDVDTGTVAKHEEDIYQRALSLLRLLRSWKEDWDLTNQSGLHDYILESPDPNCVGQRPAVPSSTKISVAALLMLYNTTLIYVLQSLISFPVKVGDVDERYHVAEKYAALEICKCIPYFMAQSTTLDIASMILGYLGVRTALKTFGGVYTVAGKTIENMIKPKEHGIVAKGLWDEWSKEDLQREGCEAAAVRLDVKRVLEDTIRK